MGDLIKYGKRLAVVNMFARGAMVAVVALPVVMAVASGGGSINLTWSFG